jgi:hypothetical protein
METVVILASVIFPLLVITSCAYFINETKKERKISREKINLMRDAIDGKNQIISKQREILNI